MRINKKQAIEECCDYILSQDHEREHLIENIKESFPHKRKTHRRRMRMMIQDSIWYKAMLLSYGRDEARKEVTQLMNEL